MIIYANVKDIDSVKKLGEIIIVWFTSRFKKRGSRRYSIDHHTERCGRLKCIT